VSVVVVGAFLLGSRLLLGAVLAGPERTATLFDRLRPSGAWGRLATLDTTEVASGAPTPPTPGRRLDTILSRGTLRVCVSPDAMPWCYLNGGGEIVGFEVDLAHAMAVELGTRLALVRVDRAATGAALVSGACDVSTRRIVPSQASSMSYSRPMTHERWAFLTLDHQQAVFASLDRVRQLPSVRLAVLNEREWIDMLKVRLPNAEVIPVGSLPEFIDAPAGRFDAMFTGYDRALAYSIASPQFAAVVPTPDLGSVPLAIAVPAGEEALRNVANEIVEVETANGVVQDKLAYWVKGEGAQRERGPRWSIARDVLGWWKR
jgi:ABC-type amino acid transport substrate-binding protein